MASETLSFDIVGRDAGASAAFRRVGDSADIAARGARTAAIALEQQRKAADASARASLSLAAADKILADAEKGLNDEALKQEFLAKKQAASLRAAASAARAAGGGSGGGGGKGFFDRGIVGGAGPGILGISAKWAGLIAGGGSLLGALPALAAIHGVIGVAGIGASVIGKGASQLIGTKTNQGPLYQAAQAAKKSFSDAFAQAATGLEAPLKKVFAEIPALMKSIGPALKALFSGAGTLIGPFVKGLTDVARVVLPDLGKAFRAVAPLIRPLLDGFAGLAKGLLPALVTLLKSARPAIGALSSVLGTLGKDLGDMLKSFAPVIRQSSLIFRSLADVIAAIFPIVGKLAAVFARTLAPVFATVAHIVRSLEPVLVLIGKVVAKFAEAVLTDLAGAFSAVAVLIKDIEPSLKILGQAFGQLFNVLENSGVFAIIGDAVEKLVPLLARLINSLVIGLKPAFPAIIKAVSQLSSALITGLVVSVTALLKVLVPLIRPLAEIVTWFVNLTSKMGPLLPLLIAGLAVWAKWSVAVKVATGVWKALTLVLDTNPFILIGTAVIVLAALIIKYHKQIWAFIVRIWGDIESFFKRIWGDIAGFFIRIWGDVVRVWQHVWGDIKNAASAAWNFLTHGWGQFLVPGLTLIRKVIEIVRDHWKAAWHVIKTAASDAWHWIYDHVIAPLKAAWNFFKSVIHGIGGFLGGNSGGGARATSPQAAIQYAGSQIGRYGWSASAQMPALVSLWNQESAWNNLARNPTSGAYGIPQALPPSKMGAAANPPMSSAIAQINWGLGYIKSRYGSPASAWGHEMNYGWYDRGGILRPGLTLAYNGTGRNEYVGGGQAVQVEWVGGNADAEFLTWLRRNIRIRGGNVQTVLGH